MEYRGGLKYFTDLIAWQKSYEFVKEIYRITENFPLKEQFGLTSQLRRSAASITANIAEGCGRYHFKDKIKFFYQARGSNTESQNHIILAQDLGYISDLDYIKLKNLVFESYKLICGLISSTNKKFTDYA